MVNSIGLLIVVLFAFLAPDSSVSQRSGKPSRVSQVNTASHLSQDPADRVTSIAVYAYTDHARELLKAKNRKYIHPTIKEREEIGLVLQAFKSKPIDGRRLLTMPDAYVFFLDSSGDVIKSGKIVGGWELLVVNDEWEKSYTIPEKGSQLLQERMQFCKRIVSQS